MILRLRHAENLVTVVIFTIVYAIAFQLILLAANPLRGQALAQDEICHTYAAAQFKEGEHERGPSCGLSCCLGLNRDDAGPALTILPQIASEPISPALTFIRAKYHCKTRFDFSFACAAGFLARAPPAQT